MFDVMVLALCAIVLVTLASLLFGEEEHLGRILLSEPPRKRGEQAVSPGRRAPWRRAPAEPVRERTEAPAPSSAPLGSATPVD
jgi:hypothetical protein